jgi:very-short-patch-repair endonuclease
MAETQDVWRGVREVARRQLGVVTREQVLEAGGSEHWLRRRTAACELQRIGRTAYSVAGVARSWEQSALAACLDIGRHAVLSHRAAGAAWQLWPEPAQIEVTVPTGHSGRGGSSSVLVHRSRSLTSREWALMGCLPVTTPARTLVDLACVVPGDALARLVEDAVCRRLVTPDRVVAAIDRSAARGRKGMAALRAALEPWDEGRGVESVAEGEFRRAIARAGLPEPVTQFEVRTGTHTKAFLDFAWPDQCVALEVDSYRWHSGPKSFSQDFIRANRLTALGWNVVRATPSELVTDGGGVIAALSRLLRVSAGSR